jgi:hypothetical protein
MVHPTKRRTFSRERWEESQRRWKEWEADSSTQMRDEWKDWRHLAATEAGIIDPPEGGRFDSWVEDNPSQLAILTRAIREIPDLLRQAVLSPNVHSWSSVIAVLLRERDRLREEADERVRREEELWEQTKKRERDEASVAYRRLGLDR